MVLSLNAGDFLLLLLLLMLLQGSVRLDPPVCRHPIRRHQPDVVPHLNTTTTLLGFKFPRTIFRAGLKFALFEFAQQCKKTMGPLLRAR